MVTIEKYFPNWKELDIHESSPGDCSISNKLKHNCKKYVSTQFYPKEPFGTIVNGFRNEDLENQTFSNGSFDLVITQDVMEHIYEPEKAFKEIARTLKKGGAHIFTVPLINKHKKSEVWATKGVDGRPVFLKNPEYHLNPLDPNGSPVTIHWGFDIVDFIKMKSGLDTTIEYIDNLDYGIRAEYIEVLVSFKT
jgi:SAM-dependent methyltransferase